MEDDTAVVDLNADEWGAAEEAVPAVPLAADHAFKKERSIAFLPFAERADRREGVAEELATHGDDGVTGRKPREIVERREVTQGVSAAAEDGGMVYWWGGIAQEDEPSARQRAGPAHSSGALFSPAANFGLTTRKWIVPFDG